MKNFVIPMLSWLAYIGLVSSVADENQFRNSETTPKSDSFKNCNPHDFIEPLTLIGHDHFITIEELNSLIKDIKHNSNMGRAFVGLLDTRQLSNIEKVSWIKSNLEKLPSPFLMLLALFEPNLEEAKSLYYLFSVYFIIDAHICEGGTGQSGLIRLADTVVPMLLKRFGIEQKEKPFLEAFEKIHFAIEKQFFEKGGFNVFAKKSPKSVQRPYWLAYEIIMNEGYWRFLGGNWPYTDAKIFKPKDQWEKIKKDVFKEMENMAKNR